MQPKPSMGTIEAPSHGAIATCTAHPPYGFSDPKAILFLVAHSFPLPAFVDPRSGADRRACMATAARADARVVRVLVVKSERASQSFG